MPIVRNNPYLSLVASAVLAAVTVSGCAAPPAPPVPTAVHTKPSAATAAPDPDSTAPATPAGPPPRKGTLAWYVYELPHFAPPPPPAHVEVVPATGPAAQIGQVDVGGQRVAFITIDDGWLKDPGVVTMLRAAHIPFTMFLTTDAIKSDPGYFRTLQGLGGVIEDHTVTHPKLSTESYAQQVHEICANRATLTSLYGRAPVIMRAPYGLADDDTRRAAASCGIRSNVFWDEYAITGTVTWQRPGGIHPGDMVLMHFDKYLRANLLAALIAFHKAGITPALLENYLVTAPTTAAP
jgi:peptidoglycan/xylan/chitin deacetylase (PgdA/CDA1 family)